MRHYLLFICLNCPFFMAAQNSISNAYFPTIGNNLITAKATNISAFSISTFPTSKGNVSWDFRNLRPQALDTQRFIAPNTEGVRLFPKANLTFKPDTNAQIPFYQRTDSTFELMGLQGLLFQGLFIRTVVKPHTPLKERRAPLKVGDTFTQSAGFKVSFPSSVAPDSLLRNSPFAIPDSMRITYDLTRYDTIDAWGTVRIPNGEFPVLRERQKESIKTKVEVLYPLLGWLDVTTLILTGLAQPFYSETLYQKYWHATTQEPIAIVETDPQNATRSVQYKAIAQRVSTPEIPDLSAQLVVFPNPVTTDLMLNFDKINVPINSILISDLSGHLILNQLIKLEKSIKLNINNWQNGAYLIYLMDNEGQIIGKQKFIKK
jgi:Secretion system C-terminal sorting domain